MNINNNNAILKININNKMQRWKDRKKKKLPNVKFVKKFCKSFECLFKISFGIEKKKQYVNIFKKQNRRTFVFASLMPFLHYYYIKEITSS